MSTPLTIVALIEAQPAQIEFVRTELEKLIPPTLEEAGCLQYDMHQDNTHPALFLFYETWETRDLWQAHMNNAHLAAFVEATDGALVSLTVHEMTKC